MEKKDNIRIWDIGLKNHQKNFFYEKLIDDEKGLTIIIREGINNSSFIKISFKEGVESYMVTEEYLILNHWDIIPNDIIGHSFYISEQTHFTKLINELSLNLYSNLKITHYMILTTSFYIDILSSNPPQVEWIDNIDDL